MLSAGAALRVAATLVVACDEASGECRLLSCAEDCVEVVTTFTLERGGPLTWMDARRVGAAWVLAWAVVLLVLRPAFEAGQEFAGFVGLISGIIAAFAYLQVSALARAAL